MVRKPKKHYLCVTEFALDVLGGKWKTLILVYLLYGTFRYGELRALLPKLSDKVLTQRLKELERAGLVRRSGTGAKRTAYSLSEEGETLRPVLTVLCEWGKHNAKFFGAVCDEPLLRLEKYANAQKHVVGSA